MYLAKVNQRVFKRSCCFYFAVRASLGFFPPCIGVTSTEQREDVLINLTNFQRTCWGNEGRSRRDSSLKNVQGKERGRESDLHFSRGEATRLDPAVFHCPELNVGLTTSTWSTFRWPDIIIYDRDEKSVSESVELCAWTSKEDQKRARRKMMRNENLAPWKGKTLTIISAR